MSCYKNGKTVTPKMSARESLELYLGEYLAGGFDVKWLKPDVKAVLDEAEGYLTDDEEFPEGLLKRWDSIKGGIYL